MIPQHVGWPHVPLRYCAHRPGLRESAQKDEGETFLLMEHLTWAKWGSTRLLEQGLLLPLPCHQCSRPQPCPPAGTTWPQKLQHVVGLPQNRFYLS